MQSITAKLGTMRKAQDWVVYPAAKTADSAPSTFIIQSDTRIAQFDRMTGAGMLSKAHSNGSYFMHLSAFMGATPFVADAALIDAARNAQPQSGDAIGGGVYVA